MPARVGLVRGHVDLEALRVTRDLRPRDVQVHRQQSRRPHEEIVGEDRVDATDASPPAR
jgi:hypothetical protein